MEQHCEESGADQNGHKYGENGRRLLRCSFSSTTTGGGSGEKQQQQQSVAQLSAYFAAAILTGTSNNQYDDGDYEHDSDECGVEFIIDIFKKLHVNLNSAVANESAATMTSASKRRRASESKSKVSGKGGGGGGVDGSGPRSHPHSNVPISAAAIGSSTITVSTTAQGNTATGLPGTTSSVGATTNMSGNTAAPGGAGMGGVGTTAVPNPGPKAPPPSPPLSSNLGASSSSPLPAVDPRSVELAIALVRLLEAAVARHLPTLLSEYAELTVILRKVWRSLLTLLMPLFSAASTATHNPSGGMSTVISGAMLTTTHPGVSGGGNSVSNAGPGLLDKQSTTSMGYYHHQALTLLEALSRLWAVTLLTHDSRPTICLCGHNWRRGMESHCAQG